MTTDYDTLEDSIRNTYASVVWSHKIQEKQADIYSQRYKVLKVIEVITVSFVSLGIVSTIFADPLWLKLLATLISFASVFVTVYLMSFDLPTLISNHKSCANSLLKIRNDLQALLLMIKLKNGTINELLEQYKNLNDEINKIYSTAPSTTDKAVKMANKALKIQQDNTYSDIEIDQYLPEGLKKVNRSE